MNRTIRVIDAPSNLGLKPPVPGKEPGVRHMPAALRACDLVNRLGAKNGDGVVPPSYLFAPPGPVGIRNAEAIAAYSLKLADALTECLDAGDFPLVLGGDCSILLGSTLALRERGKYGLLFIDAHPDLLTPATSSTGGAAGMDLALAVGTGPELLTRLRGHYPLMDEQHVVILGYQHSTQVTEHPAVKVISYKQVMKRGAVEATGDALARFEAKSLSGFWIHCDVDVLDSDLMPAVDSPHSGGLTYAALRDVLHTALNHPLCAGMQVTIFDPDLDPTGGYARELTNMLVNAFVSS